MQKSKLIKQQKKANDYIRLLGWILVIIVPTILIINTYISTYRESLKVTFDIEVTPNSVYVEEFILSSELQTIDLVVDWIEFKRPNQSNSGELSDGSYTFHISYTVKPGISVSQVMVTPVLQTKWASIREVGASQLIGSSAVEYKIDFNHLMPQRPLYFIKVDEPILYLKISLVQQIGSNQIPHTYYVIYDLTHQYPSN
jgi:hypothetical protein